MEEMHPRKSRDQQLVMLSRVLQSECNISYEEHQGFRVKKVNGVELLNLAHLWQMIQVASLQLLLLFSDILFKATEPKDFVELEMAGGSLVVIQKGIGDKATKKLLKTHRISAVTNL